MLTNCSICLQQPSSGLTSLFVYREDKWYNNGLSNMLEAVLDRKINNKHKAQLSICNHCIKKLTDTYLNTDEKIEKEFHFAELDSMFSLKTSSEYLLVLISCFFFVGENKLAIILKVPVSIYQSLTLIIYKL